MDIAFALEGLFGSRAAPEKINFVAQPSLYILIASSARALVSPPLTATIASDFVRVDCGDK